MGGGKSTAGEVVYVIPKADGSLIRLSAAVNSLDVDAGRNIFKSTFRKNCSPSQALRGRLASTLDL